MKIFYFIIFIIVFSFSSVVFAKTEVWDCKKVLHKIDTDKPDISVRSKDDKKWLSAKELISSVFIEYNTKSETIIMYQQGRVIMAADLVRRVVISFDTNPIDIDQCELY
jgi:hypothetical protein